MKKRILSLALAIVLTVAMAVPAFAAGTKNVTITANYGKGYTYSYTIPNVLKTETMKTADKADKSKWVGFEEVPSFAEQDVTVYTIKKNEKIYIGGAYGFGYNSLVYKGGKLEGSLVLSDDETLRLSTINTFNTDNIYDSDGMSHTNYTSASYIAFKKAGYYSLFIYAFYSPYPSSGRGAAITGLKQQNRSSYNLKHGAVILRVIDDSTTSSSNDNATADENTVEVVGQARTPGEIQSYRSGGYLYTVNHGDTLYDLTERFYGDGSLWKELQKANQKYLNETQDGIIFVGFNLLIPDSLGGVRANIR